MQIINFGEHYFPPPKIREDLEQVIIFTENVKKRNIPNGSVWVYKNKPYFPPILGPDVGCGITAFITEKIPDSKNSHSDILKAVNEIGIHIGQGNHFLDITTGLPNDPTTRRETSMIYLHSDFNNANVIPRSYEEAKDLERDAKEKRIDYILDLARILGINATFYNDWTHNSVNRKDGKMTYRKGAINLEDTEGIGALALNPLDGILLYAGALDDYHHSAQHGLGRIGSKGQLIDKLTKSTIGIARGYHASAEDIPELERIKKQIYKPIDSFTDQFYTSVSAIGVCVPQLIVTTKKS